MTRPERAAEMRRNGAAPREGAGPAARSASGLRGGFPVTAVRRDV